MSMVCLLLRLTLHLYIIDGLIRFKKQSLLWISKATSKCIILGSYNGEGKEKT